MKISTEKWRLKFLRFRFWYLGCLGNVTQNIFSGIDTGKRALRIQHCWVAFSVFCWPRVGWIGTDSRATAQVLSVLKSFLRRKSMFAAKNILILTLPHNMPKNCAHGFRWSWRMTLWNQTLFSTPQWQIDITPRSNAIPWYPMVFFTSHQKPPKDLLVKSSF
jgi:hypothetical protein